ncbi:MAG: GNAT family N-acetyltransferase [Lachnospiraceae bacterium]|nr:GNAT family N-acetyltransferase [Lachnospiraceae bacterium]
MTEYVKIDEENAMAFRKLIVSGAYPFLLMPDIFAIGVTEDNVAIAAEVFRIGDDGGAELLSICVDEKYRRQGLASEMLAAAADFICDRTDVNRFYCSYDDTGEQEAFIGFLKSFDFNIEEDEDCCIRTTVGDLKQISVLQSSGKSNCIAFEDTTSLQKKMLGSEDMDLEPYMNEGVVDGKMSCIMMDDSQLCGCLIFTNAEDGSLDLSWARNDGDQPENMLKMLRHAVAGAKDYPEDKKIYIPLLNAQSRKLAEGLLKGHYEKCEQSYNAELYLFDEE